MSTFPAVRGACTAVAVKLTRAVICRRAIDTGRSGVTIRDGVVCFILSDTLRYLYLCVVVGYGHA